MKKNKQEWGWSKKQQNTEASVENEMHCDESLVEAANNRSRKSEQKEGDRYKRKKKNQSKKQKRNKKQQATLKLKNIINDFYALQATFEQRQQAIEQCLQFENNEDKFYDSINLVIKDQVDIISAHIHKLTKELYELYITEEAIDPMMLAELYEKIETIRQASPEVEKVINYFLMKKKKIRNSQHQNLDKLTFKFIFENDVYKEHFQELCEWILEDCKDEKQKVLVKEMMDLLISIDEFEDEDESSSESEEWDNSTLESLAELDENLKKENSSGRRKKKKKKYEQLDDPLNYQVVIKRLNNMAIERKGQASCKLDEKWLKVLADRVQKQL